MPTSIKFYSFEGVIKKSEFKPQEVGKKSYEITTTEVDFEWLAISSSV